MDTPLIPYMLSYIWQRHCRIVAFSRSLIIKSRMAPLKVVSVDMCSDNSSSFPDIAVLCQICFFIFEASEPALDHDIICPSAFAIIIGIAYHVFFIILSSFFNK